MKRNHGMTSKMHRIAIIVLAIVLPAAFVAMWISLSSWNEGRRSVENRSRLAVTILSEARTKRSSISEVVEKFRASGFQVDVGKDRPSASFNNRVTVHCGKYVSGFFVSTYLGYEIIAPIKPREWNYRQLKSESGL